jgi:hypothetical protein
MGWNKDFEEVGSSEYCEDLYGIRGIVLNLYCSGAVRRRRTVCEDCEARVI